MTIHDIIGVGSSPRATGTVHPEGVRSSHPSPGVSTPTRYLGRASAPATVRQFRNSAPVSGFWENGKPRSVRISTVMPSRERPVTVSIAATSLAGGRKPPRQVTGRETREWTLAISVSPGVSIPIHQIPLWCRSVTGRPRPGLRNRLSALPIEGVMMTPDIGVSPFPNHETQGPDAPSNRLWRRRRAGEFRRRFRYPAGRGGMLYQPGARQVSAWTIITADGGGIPVPQSAGTIRSPATPRHRLNTFNRPSGNG